MRKFLVRESLRIILGTECACNTFASLHLIYLETVEKDTDIERLKECAPALCAL